MSQSSKALLLVNLGTPDKPQKKEVFFYLTQFLNDRRVIDLPLVFQKLLVNLIIIPFRLANSTKLYQKLWTDKGSPLLYYLENLQKKLKQEVSSQMDVYAAMRYGNPSLNNVLAQIKDKNYEEVIVFPLFPQYASSTTGSVYEKIVQLTKDWQNLPSFRFVNQYHSHPAFVEAFAEQIRSYDPSQYDHIVFSYHGLPNRHLHKIHPQNEVSTCNCSVEMPAHGTLCYKATCYETTRLLAKKLQLEPSQYTVSFQSRLSKNWMTPFTDETLIDLAKKGHKKVLITAPSFVADCLETHIELGLEYQELFEQNGGEKLVLVTSLNDTDTWVNAIQKILHS